MYSTVQLKPFKHRYKVSVGETTGSKFTGNYCKMNASNHSSTTALLNSSNVITLRGSTDIVKEFFNFSVNNILYQRGVYPPESFKRVANYGLPMMITTDEALLGYLTNVMRQLEGASSIESRCRVTFQSS